MQARLDSITAGVAARLQGQLALQRSMRKQDSAEPGGQAAGSGGRGAQGGQGSGGSQPRALERDGSNASQSLRLVGVDGFDVDWDGAGCSVQLPRAHPAPAPPVRPPPLAGLLVTWELDGEAPSAQLPVVHEG